MFQNISINFIEYCIKARNGANVSLIQLFSNYESTLTELRYQYLRANNSSEILNQLLKKMMNKDLYPTLFTTIDTVFRLSNILERISMGQLTL